MSDLYCVFGHPIHHSRSPALHAAFAAQTGEAVHYEARDPGPDGFLTGWQAFVEAGGQGANVTVPFKEAAWRLADQLSDRAARAGAANTLKLMPDGTVLGDNTDGVGLVRDLIRLGARLDGGRVLILGAGGAVRGVLGPLLDEMPREVVIANRTPDKARLLSEAFGRSDASAVTGGHFDEVTGNFDVIINGTSASLAGALPALPGVRLTPDTLAYDMMYGAAPTVFMDWAAREGARCEDGLGMLVEQAAESFMTWRGVHPDTGPVREAIRQALTASLDAEAPRA
ncbi:shikimate dehydrogenase [Larsenimonas rhizosphaerae]|uniref:Shikimate dehydrogenase (NADP(+)) n=1 Tax=Larsenimonas rhizosphaerae TaxID=2944682 RepID=A0AA41ZMF1_9GAMM|nr:shikimate dehydrogenase [Larsenimonas rhizosphaerae]MCM2129887.1 shikimate dehydrogenase [Larsenimonas rhizosphaerae]MCX2524548.1 shikimate dehydrogenase [Larsenimonas rhizosphaerae]